MSSEGVESMTKLHPETEATVAPAPAAEADGLPRVRIDGMPFVALELRALSMHIAQQAGRGLGGWVVTLNTDILRRCRRDASFRELVRDASVFTADGAPIVWASRLQGTPLPGRLTGSDLFTDLYARAVRAGLRVALIGGNPGAADAAVAELGQREGLGARLVRTLCPSVGFESLPVELKAIDDLLAVWQPQLVFVGLGSPKQERLIHRLRGLRPGAWYLGVGVSFSFVAGDVRRAPAWVQRAGLEWLHRLVQEPRRLARRYLVDGVPFAAGLLVRAALRRRS